MKRLPLLLAVFLLLSSGVVMADTFHFTGTIEFHNDIGYTHFTVGAAAINIRIWTDSFQNDTNFDPITALWTSGGALIAQNDDNPTINPATQTLYDSGIFLPTLAAGDYIFSIASWDNFAFGPNLSNGFTYDGQTPIPIANFWVQRPGYWSLWLDVESATNPNAVPEPASLFLLGTGLCGIAFAAWRRKR